MARKHVASKANNHAGSGLALPLVLIYCGLVAYASLYPFAPWHFQGVMPWAFVTAPLPKYWSGFDVFINVLGYIPLGFLFGLLYTRQGEKGGAWIACLSVAVLSFCMEALQTYLAPRVSSNVDWGLNILGGALGVWIAILIDSLGLLGGWSRWRSNHFDAGSGTALGLLLLWPLALLYPTPVPLGLGQMGGWMQWLAIAPSPHLQSFLITLGLLAPSLLAFAITAKLTHRLFELFWILLAAFTITTLSSGLSFAPEHALVWLDGNAWRGLWIGLAAIGVSLFAPRRLCLVLALIALVLLVALINTTPQNPYFAQTLAVWEQGRFIRFYGATQWLGWLWPYAAALWVISKLVPHKN
jgi:VanZ family protein